MTLVPFSQGVVTAATSLIITLAQKNPDDFKTAVSLAVARLSRVSSPSLKFTKHFHTIKYVQSQVGTLNYYFNQKMIR